MVIFRLLVAATVSIYALLTTFTPGTYRFLDRVDLIFHEAGHMIFTPFGQSLHMLGGTLGQLFFPIAFVLHFIRRREPFSAAVVMFWVGQNFYNIAWYMRDAKAMQIPLLGGEVMTHDWNWMLSKLGLLNACKFLGGVVFALGVVAVLLSIAGMFTYAARER